MDRKATAAAFRRQQELMGVFAQGEWDGDALAGLQESKRTIAHLCRAIHHGTRGREETWKFVTHGLPGFTYSDVRLDPYALLRLIFTASAKHEPRGYCKLASEWKIEDGFYSDSFLDPAMLLHWIELLGIAHVDAALSSGNGVFAPNGAHFRLAPIEKKRHEGLIKGTAGTVDKIEDELDDVKETRRGDLSLAVSMVLLAPELIVPGEVLIFSGTKFVMRDYGRGEDQAFYLTITRMENGRISFSTIDATMVWNCVKPCSVRMIKGKKS